MVVFSLTTLSFSQAYQFASVAVSLLVPAQGHVGTIYVLCELE